MLLRPRPRPRRPLLRHLRQPTSRGQQHDDHTHVTSMSHPSHINYTRAASTIVCTSTLQTVSKSKTSVTPQIHSHSLQCDTFLLSSLYRPNHQRTGPMRVRVRVRGGSASYFTILPHSSPPSPPSTTSLHEATYLHRLHSRSPVGEILPHAEAPHDHTSSVMGRPQHQNPLPTLGKNNAPTHV
ncbi:hypothetical protein K504DRAFT_300612 [Pleomassaria siparia CBS 279.74]|uniref:Uncharacterized protein n=1 Tax=Pleomassaria siparia CBS 279.74 TaxID=1314801 RepID=A0A6G1K6U9_9PLEO|nr:hypothetical protein K504DRAFT_300612 [Pleomassaria siparia CBS 279.74]